LAAVDIDRSKTNYPPHKWGWEMVVYLITNTVNSKIYVGKTVQPIERRWSNHLKEAKRRSGYYLYRAMRKYGTSAFTIQAIATAETDEQLRELEIYWIRELRSNDPAIGYNMTKGGDGPAGWVMSEATKKKIRLKALGRVIPQTTRDAVSRRHKGVPLSAEHKCKIAAHWDLNRRDAQGQRDRERQAEGLHLRPMRRDFHAGQEGCLGRPPEGLRHPAQKERPHSGE
jgi:group I intron endonuclease